MIKNAFFLCLSLVLVHGQLAAQQPNCQLPGRNSPAVPVPECVDSSGAKVACSAEGSIRLWPDRFQPASRIPAVRDSTDRVAGKSIPGLSSGHELFSGLDVVTVDGVSRRLYVSYNAGLQAWDIEGPRRAKDPRRLRAVDGWAGQFLQFPKPDEVLSFILDIAALNADATADVVGVAGNSPVGTSLWEFNTGIQNFRQLYQDTATNAKQIRMVKMDGGTIYAFVGAGNGLAVYNVTAARALADEPCLDSQGSECPTVFRGFVKGTANTSKLFVDTLHVAGADRVFVSSSGGLRTELELWQLDDPQKPERAIRRFSGLKHAQASALFAYGGHSYLAVVSEKDGLNKEKLRIFMIDGCIKSDRNCSIGSASMEEVVKPISLQGFATAKDFLTYSETAGRPFLYYGVGTGNLDGSDLEKLFDLSSLRPPGRSRLASLPEVTESGGSYTDPCNGSEIRYWSHYYHSNARGLNNTVPRTGKFSSAGYFYRAAASILDVHVIESPPSDKVFADGFESGDAGGWKRVTPKKSAGALSEESSGESSGEEGSGEEGSGEEGSGEEGSGEEGSGEEGSGEEGSGGESPGVR